MCREPALARERERREADAQSLSLLVAEGREQRRREEEAGRECGEREEVGYVVSLVAVSHLAAWSRALALLRKGEAGCVDCLYSHLQEGAGQLGGRAAALSLALGRGATAFLGLAEGREARTFIGLAEGRGARTYVGMGEGWGAGDCGRCQGI